jgi:hypothetical protein
MADYMSGGGVWESNPPTGGLTRSTGFEVQGPHQQPNASIVIFQLLAACERNVFRSLL